MELTDNRVGAHEGRINSPLLTVNQWGTALKLAQFGGVEVATDILGYQASVMAASTRPSEILVNGKAPKSLKIVMPESVKSKTHLQGFGNDLLERLGEAGYNLEVVDLPQSPNKLDRYIVFEDGAQP
jgi:hypothetical protein